MNSLIPLEYYSIVYYNLLLIIVIVFFSQSNRYNLVDSQNIASKNKFGYFLLIFLLIFIGLRPISFVFGDMGVYAIEFDNYRKGILPKGDKDVVFEFIIRVSSTIMSANMFFFMCTCLYIIPIFVACKSLFKEYYFYAFFILILSFSFWAYGTNGIRNGIATSFFIYAISRKNRFQIFALMIFCVFIHKSLLIPTTAYIISLFYKNTKIFLAFWILTIPTSFVLGGVLENFFLGIGIIDDDRIIGYLSKSDEYLDKIIEVKRGFRWDFIVYSALGVFAGWYYIVKKKFDDATYNQLFSIYLMSNGLWVLVIRSNFSNRIAYLSWFLLGIIIIYPLLKNNFFIKQNVVISKIIFAYFMITYLLDLIIK